MKYSIAVAFTGLVALVSAVPQAASPSESGAASQTSASLTPTQSCVVACQDDLSCQAACVGVPAPNQGMVNSTTDCAAQCDQGDGSPADTQAYAECQQGCISSLFFTGTAASGPQATLSSGSSATESGSVPATTTGSTSETGSSGSSASETGSSVASETASSESESESSSATGTASGSAASSSATGAASSNLQMGASAAGVFGIMMAAFAL